ncbi:hypothetical protein KIW84_033588 [Lathyrus oleraceus]|uniref:Uncharacterized protein n=1 Tax=Pisum sativum TaxID=3888 RepID=A0A9D4XW63_PEA|nr:hypothetical protein KIW84_033588 [Pisum sativum]
MDHQRGANTKGKQWKPEPKPPEINQDTTPTAMTPKEDPKLNKESKLREISFRLLNLKAKIDILIQTRVKHSKAKLVRDKLSLTGTIYSRIDRVLGNVEWFQANMDTTLNILPRSVSNHALLYVARLAKMGSYKGKLKFYNCMVAMVGYENVSAKSVRVLHRDDGVILNDQKDIEKELMDFYGSLMGKVANNLNHVDVEAMRSGRQINMEQREFPVGIVTKEEISKAL